MTALINDKSETGTENSYLYPDSPVLQYYQFPEFLLKVPMSQTARILYMMLYDRARLSQRNNWIDDEGRVYLTFTIMELAEKSGRSISTVKAGLNELRQADLLVKNRVGCGKPNRLYVRVPSDTCTSERQISALRTGGKQSPKQTNRISTMSKSSRDSKQSVHWYRGRRAGPFEDYSYDWEESL